MKITVVCEHNPSMDSPEGLAAYPQGMGNCLKDIFASAGHDVTLITYDDVHHAEELTLPVVYTTDVLVWWGHWYHDCIPDETAAMIADQVGKGMGFIALHSAHHSKPFRRLMGTSCNLLWREINEKERLWIMDPNHPITKGLPEYFELAHEEMYGERFDIPTPDELVFLSWFQGGEVMRSGCVWRRGLGKVFFLRCGHETNPTYHNEYIRTTLQNAAAYVCPTTRIANFPETHRPMPPEGNIVIKD